MEMDFAPKIQIDTSSGNSRRNKKEEGNMLKTANKQLFIGTG